MNHLYVFSPLKTGTIKPELYGHFTEHIGGVIYDGIYVGENSPVPNIRGFRKEILEKLRAIHAPVIRWPGGCYAEMYDWRDGIGPKNTRPTRISWWTKYDGKYESNEVGTHEFCDFCELAGAKAYFAANLTSVSPLHIRNWVDYATSPAGTTTLSEERRANGHPDAFDIPFWGIGNENWGGGGNMTPETYAHEWRRYATVVKNANPELKLIACGPNAEDWEWSRRFLAIAREHPELMSGYALHYYCFNREDNPVDFGEKDWYRMLWQAARMQVLIDRHWGYIRGYGLESQAKLYIDEWGAWHPDGSGPSRGANLYEQQSTLRDANISAIYLNIFNNNCDKVDMANAAQLVNNLHALFLTAGEHCITTPTYHVFDLWKNHRNGTAVKTENDCGIIEFPGKTVPLRLRRVSSSASVKNGILTLTLQNSDYHGTISLKLVLCGIRASGKGVLRSLWAEHPIDCNTFENPDLVKPTESETDGVSLTLRPGEILSLSLPIEEDL